MVAFDEQLGRAEFFGDISRNDPLKGVYMRTFLAENFGYFCENWLDINCEDFSTSAAVKGLDFSYLLYSFIILYELFWKE